MLCFQLYSDQNQKPILVQKQLFLLNSIRGPEQSFVSLLFQSMSMVLWLIYKRTHCSLKPAQIFKIVLPNDCEVQRFTTRYGNIVKMGLSLLNGSYRLDVRKLALSIGRNAWKQDAEIFVTMCSCKNCLNSREIISCELTYIVLRCVFRFEKVRCAKVPALHISCGVSQVC